MEAAKEGLRLETGGTSPKGSEEATRHSSMLVTHHSMFATLLLRTVGWPSFPTNFVNVDIIYSLIPQTSTDSAGSVSEGWVVLTGVGRTHALH